MEHCSEASSDGGCPFCRVLRDGLQIKCDLLTNTSNPILGRIILQVGCPLEVEITASEQNKTPEYRVQYHTIEGNAGTDPKWSVFGVAKAISPEVPLERCSEIFSCWIRNCDETHTRCSFKRGEKSRLPSRLLDVEPRADKSVVLVDTRTSVCETDKYLTLSHCWGNHRFIQTKKDSLEARMRNIEWELLPRTFQDAVGIAQAFGIRYIWIDSLCIIQDDELDWKQESTRMASIYSNSYLNIAATGSADGRGGCLSSRSIESGLHASSVESILIKPSCTSQPNIFVRPSLERIHNRYSTQIKHYSLFRDANSVPLLTRAWVFQERYLAPRTLHFHPSEVIFECNTGLRCECSGLDSIRSPLHHELDAGVATPDKLRKLKDQYNNWFRVVEEFSRLSLTRQTDRLIALIGVATVFQEELSDDYLVGLWKGDIARGLLWHIARPESFLTRRHESVFAPTWSWASLILDNEEVGIVFPTGHDDSFEMDKRFEFLQTSILPDAANSSDSANDVLRLKGAVVSAIMCVQNPVETQAKDAFLILDVDIDDDFVFLATSGFDIDVSPTEENKILRDTHALVHCLVVGNTIDDFNDTKSTGALVLSLGISGAYERIGVFEGEMNDQSATIMELDLI